MLLTISVRIGRSGLAVVALGIAVAGGIAIAMLA